MAQNHMAGTDLPTLDGDRYEAARDPETGETAIYDTSPSAGNGAWITGFTVDPTELKR